MTLVQSPRGQVYDLRSVTYRVPSATTDGTMHTVVIDDAGRHCSCKAYQYGRPCWHLRAVKDGNAGKPYVRLMPLPPPPAEHPGLASVRDLYEV